MIICRLIIVIEQAEHIQMGAPVELAVKVVGPQLRQFDGRTFFLSHSNKREIIAFDYDEKNGAISNRRLFAIVPPEDGIPDGAAIDSEGGYWSALHGGAKLRRFHPGGSVDLDIDLPVSQPTMPAFAGKDLATLYVTSASDQMSAEAKAREPHAGGLFRLKTRYRGVARSYLVR